MDVSEKRRMQGEMITFEDSHDRFSIIGVPEGAPIDLTCEECERRTAKIFCEACNEVLCPTCCDLTHLAGTATNRPFERGHPHLMDGEIRRLRKGDRSSILKGRPPNEHEALRIPQNNEPITEDMLTASGYNLSVPTPAEAPRINLITSKSSNGKARPNNEYKFSCGNIVLCDVPGEDTPEGDQLLGIIVETPKSKIGPRGVANKRADGDALCYSVEILGRPSPDFSDVPALLASSSSSSQQSWNLPPLLSERVVIVGGTASAPLVKERKEAATRDAYIRAVRERALPPESVSRSVFATLNGAPNAKRAEIMVIQEGAMRLLEEVSQERKGRKNAGLKRALVRRINRDRLVRTKSSFEWWKKWAEMKQAEALEKASQILQAQARGWLARSNVAKMIEERDAQLKAARRRVHHQFKQLISDDDRIAAGGGVTADGTTFFATKKWLLEYQTYRRRIVTRAFKHLFLTAKKALSGSFRTWADITKADRKASIWSFNVASDISLIEDENENEKNHVPISAYNAGISLPPLPSLWYTVGKTQSNPRRNSVLASLRGPAASTSWVIPGRVLMGAFPNGESKARIKPFLDRDPSPEDLASRFLLAGIGVICGIVPISECEGVEAKLGIRPMNEIFQGRLSALTASLNAQADEASHMLSVVMKEERACLALRTIEGYSVDKLHSLLASISERDKKVRSTLLASRRAARLLPKKVEIIWASRAVSHMEGQDPDSLISACEMIEARLRNGENVCIWSTQGHGRVGVVASVSLGRLYGLDAEEALARVQQAHSAREDQYTHRNLNPPVSCPQALCQRRAVHLALAIGSDPARTSAIRRWEPSEYASFYSSKSEVDNTEEDRITFPPLVSGVQ